MKVRTRFAPSPTGFMHIGNLRTALYAYLFAKHNDGDFILRIEDTDRERYTEGAVDMVYKTLKTAGLEHDEGPDKDGGVGPYIQSERKDIYKKYAEELVKLGGAYYCFCSKERLESLTDENGNRRYDKHCLSLSKEEVETRLKNGEPYVIRQNMPTTGTSEYDDMVYGHIAVDCAELEDNILLKSDGMPTYNFANVVDDHLMGITHVMRGTEYLSSTPKYNLIYDSFGWERPKYVHLPPIMKDATRKLSKRYGDANFEDFVNKGYIPEAIVNYIALLGWSPKNDKEKMSLEELKELFTIEGINKSSAIFDETKMRWLNSEYIKAMDEATFLKYATPWFEQSKIAGKYDYRKFFGILAPRIETFMEIPDKVNFLEEYEQFGNELYFHKKMKTDSDLAKTLIPEIISTMENITDWSHDIIHDTLIALAEQLGVKNGQVLWTVRVALTGKESTPGGAIEMADILGKDESLARMHKAYEWLN